ncbi:MAG: TetR/AcrR family transcriptional regulator [Eggerthellaceae bacterium]|nr:TetR/AcrR family transcriptional regulator [Eggerthellaceae bacterium]
MARPRKDQEGPGARERIEDAFWRLMGEMPYRDITIRGLCSRADVNPNTFYSYFGCMDDLARDAFEESLVSGFPALIMGVISSGASEEDVEAVTADAHVAQGLGRMLLLARSESPYLAGLVQDTVRDAWLASAGRTADDLTREERAGLAAVVGAQMALLSSRDPEFGLHDLAELATRPLGAAMVSTLAALRRG